MYILENILHRALFWRRTEQTSSNQLGSRCWLQAKSSAMELLFLTPSLGPYSTSRESITIIRVWAGGGRSDRGSNTALRTCEEEADTQCKTLHLRQCNNSRIRGLIIELKKKSNIANTRLCQQSRLDLSHIVSVSHWEWQSDYAATSGIFI